MRMINYIRHQVAHRCCPVCDAGAATDDALQTHMRDHAHYGVPGPEHALWESPQYVHIVYCFWRRADNVLCNRYLFPFDESDPMLTCIDFGDDDDDDNDGLDGSGTDTQATDMRAAAAAALLGGESDDGSDSDSNADTDSDSDSAGEGAGVGGWQRVRPSRGGASQHPQRQQRGGFRGRGRTAAATGAGAGAGGAAAGGVMKH